MSIFCYLYSSENQVSMIQGVGVLNYLLGGGMPWENKIRNYVVSRQHKGT